MSQGRVLIIAGSDCSGGAGLQADIKSAMLLGAYAMTAVTAVTVQNTQGVSDVHSVPPDMIGAQIKAVLEDVGADAIKTGMLGDAPTIKAVAHALQPFLAAHKIPVIVDPVMRAKGGAALLAPEAVAALKDSLLPLATLITPNIPELEALSGKVLADDAALVEAAQSLAKDMGCAVLAKGGHGTGAVLYDYLCWPDGRVRQWETARLETVHTHGTGCTMASAIASACAKGQDLETAVGVAHRLVRAAILAAPGFGHGHGPLGHHLLQTPFA